MVSEENTHHTNHNVEFFKSSHALFRKVSFITTIVFITI